MEYRIRAALIALGLCLGSGSVAAQTDNTSPDVAQASAEDGAATDSRKAPLRPTRPEWPEWPEWPAADPPDWASPGGPLYRPLPHIGVEVPLEREQRMRPDPYSEAMHVRGPNLVAWVSRFPHRLAPDIDTSVENLQQRFPNMRDIETRDTQNGWELRFTIGEDGHSAYWMHRRMEFDRRAVACSTLVGTPELVDTASAWCAKVRPFRIGR